MINLKKKKILWFIYIELLVFYTELTHLTQKLKNLD